MRAAVYERGGPAAEVLELRDLPAPEPGPGEVRVRIAVSGVNPTDWKARARGSVGPAGFQIPNQDGAGVIDAVGAGVDPARAGERVWVYFAAYRRSYGTAAEHTVVPARQAVALPDAVGFDLGAGLGIPAMTAHRCVFADGPVRDSTVLVAGGAGAVGHHAIELARWGGARVIATASTPAKAELARAAGAEHVVDYRAPDAAERIRELAPAGVERIVEVALGPNLELDLAVAAPGAVITCYAADGADPQLPLMRLMTTNATLRFVLVYTMPEAALAQAAAEVTAALEAGALSALPLHRFGLADTAAAHDAVAGGAVGKVLIDVAG